MVTYESCDLDSARDEFSGSKTWVCFFSFVFFFVCSLLKGEIGGLRKFSCFNILF